MKKKKNNFSETLFISYIEDLNKSPEWVHETLKENNIDPTVVAGKSNALAGRLLAQMKLKAAKADKQGLLHKAAQLLQQAGNIFTDLPPKEKLYQLLSTHKQSAITFKNVKDFSTEDVLQMLSEIELMELIEKLQNKEP